MLSCSDHAPAPAAESDSLVTPVTLANVPLAEEIGPEGETIGSLPFPAVCGLRSRPRRAGCGRAWTVEHGVSFHSVLGKVVEKQPDLGVDFFTMSRRHSCRARAAGEDKSSGAATALPCGG